MAKLSGLKRGTNGNRENAGSGSSNLMAVAVDYKFATDGRAPNRKDRMVVGLLQDVPGTNLKATFDENGKPTTLVDLVLNYYENNANLAKKVNVEKRTQIQEFLVGKDGKDKVRKDSGYVMAIEGAYYDEREGALVARYMRRASETVQSDTKHRQVFVNNLVAVFPERSTKNDDGSLRYYQNSFIPFTDGEATKVLSGMDGFEGEGALAVLKEQIAERFALLDAAAEDLCGTAGVMLRLCGIDEDTNLPEGAHYYCFRGWDRETKSVPDVNVAAETAVQSLLSEEQFAEVLASTAGDPDIHWELVPFQSVRTGARSLPSAWKADREAQGKTVSQGAMLARDAATPYKVLTDEETNFPQVGFAYSNMAVRRDMDDITGEWKRHYTTMTYTVENFVPTVYAGWEIPTENLPEKFLTPIQASVQERTETRRRSISERSKGNAAPKDDAAEEPAAGTTYNNL